MSDILAHLDRTDAPARLGTDTEWGLFGLWADTLPVAGNEAVLHLWEHGWEDDLEALERQLSLALAEHPPEEGEVYQVTSNLLDVLQGRGEADTAIAIGVDESEAPADA